MRVRAAASIALIAVAAVLLLAGTVALYARAELVDEREFGARAVAALDRDAVRHAAGREIVARLIDRGSTDLVAARPLLESVAGSALQTEPGRRLVRAAAVEVNRALFVRGEDNIAFDVSDAAELVAFATRSVSPRVAREIPEGLDGSLIALREREFATQTLALADDVRVLGLVLPALALVAFAAAIAIAPDHRVAAVRAGVATGASGLVVAIALVLVRARVLAEVQGTDELTDAEVAAAVGGVFDAYLGDLFTWGLAVALFGLVVAGAAAALGREHLGAPLLGARRLLDRPRTPGGRAVRGAGALALGVFAVLDPDVALRIGGILAGALLVLYGTAELLALLPGRGAADAQPGRPRRRALATAGVAGLVAVGGAATLIAVAAGGGESGAASRTGAPAGTCNGSADLCDLRLNEAVFAGTHNSFSAADSPGWFIANQRRPIAGQLQDGIRLFLIDTHWGVEGGDGRVRTDFEAEGRERNRVASALPPAQLRAAERLAGRVGVRGTGAGERGVWLCHSVCELGATRLEDALVDVREFLEDNRGEVVILFVEDYVPPRDFAAVAARAGLDRFAATLDRDEPLPALGELVRTDKRVIVIAEEDADGSVPWYMDGFTFVQDTPLGAQMRDQLSCERFRGTADSPLLMLNHWADIFPPRLRANRPFQQREFLVRRAHRCARERGHPVNMIAVDHYEQGDLLEAVDELNAEQIRSVRRARAQLAGGEAQ
jgi:hypothetical protein